MEVCVVINEMKMMKFDESLDQNLILVIVTFNATWFFEFLHLDDLEDTFLGFINSAASML